MEGKKSGGRGLRLSQALQRMQETKPQEPQGHSSTTLPSTTLPSDSGHSSFGGRGNLKRLLKSYPKSFEIPPTLPYSVSSSSTPLSSSVALPPRSIVSQLSGLTTRTQSPTLYSEKASSSQLASQLSSPISLIEPLTKFAGSDGTLLRAHLNYIQVKTDPDIGIHAYHCTFEPQIDSRALRNRVLHSAELKEIIGNIMNYTGTNLYLPKKIENCPISIETSHPNDPSLKIIVTIYYIKKPPHQELISFYNSLFNQVLRELKLVEIKSNHFDPACRVEIPHHKLEIWPGLVCAIQEVEDGLMLNCDISHRLLRTNTARDILIEVLQNLRKRGSVEQFQSIVKKRLVGTIVLTRYNNKPYRVDDIDFSQNPACTFQLSNGINITYIEYFKKNWDITIKDEGQPLLIHRPKPKKGQVASVILNSIANP